MRWSEVTDISNMIASRYYWPSDATTGESPVSGDVRNRWCQWLGNLIFSDHDWPWVTETSESETEGKGELLYIIYGQEVINNLWEYFLGENWREEKFCAVVMHEWMETAHCGQFHLLLDMVTNSLLSPYSPTLYNPMLPSLELSSSFSELSAFLAFVITRIEVEVDWKAVT